MKRYSSPIGYVYSGVVLLIALALIWPGPILFASRIEPLIFGLPPALAWNVGWVLVSFLALLTYHLKVHGKD